MRYRRSAHRWGWIVMSALSIELLSAVDLAAQGSGANIIGRVTDESGGVLPGVTVTASSPALQVGTVTTVTDEQGEYRLTPLPIGTFALDFELAGFQTVRREDIRLTVGFTARIDVALNVGSVEENITVSAQPALVDVTSTSATTQFTREQLEVLPTSRNGLLSLMAQAPGVRGTLEAGGNITFNPPGIRVFGQGAEPWYVLEGVFTTSLQTAGGVGQYWDYNAIDEAAVQTIGTNAEVGSRGVFINAVVKNGGNDFSGNLFGARMSDRLQSNNIDDELERQGISSGGRLISRYDLSGELGGRIVRDKLWFFGAGRYRFNQTEVLGAYQSDGVTPATADMGQRFITTKLSYQMNPANRFVGFYQYSLRKPSSTGSINSDWISRSTTYLYQRVQKIEWQTLPTKSIVLSLQWGHWAYWDPRRFCIGKEELGGRECEGSRFDRFLNYSTGAPVNEGETLDYSRHHPKAVMNWYKANFLGGNHDFQFGVEYMPNQGYRGNYVALSGQNYRLIYNNGAPIEIEAWNYPTFPNQHVNYFGLYGQDSMTINRRLTLNIGVRYGYDNASIPASCREIADGPSGNVFPVTCYDKVQFNVQNMVSPRVRASFDVTGDGMTILKGGWGRYNQMHMIDPDVQGADPNEKSTARFRWNDLNGNRAYDDGEVNWELNGPGFIALTGGSNFVPNPEERTPKTDEFSLTFERQLPRAMAARVSGVYTRTSDVYRVLNLRRPPDVWSTAITRPDPGNDGLVGTGDDPGTNVTFYTYPAALSGRAFELYTLVNDPQATQSYTSIELALARRMVNGWQFSGSYSATRTNNPIVNGLNPGEFDLTNRGGSLDPNAEIFAANRTWEWLLRLSGAYRFPLDFMVSANFEHRSGVPRAREVQFTGVPVLSTIVLRTEPIGTQRLPNINTFDVRLDKTLRLGTKQRLQFRLNIYNVLNANAVTAMTFRAGPDFLRPTAILPPRNIEYSVLYAF